MIDELFETKHGFDKLQLMLNLMKVLESEDTEKEHNNFEMYLSGILKRDLKPEERIKLAEGILSYVHSEEDSKERGESMEYLFNAEFIID